MDLVYCKDCPEKGMPLYDMRQLFHIEMPFTDMVFSYIAIQPGQRVPTEGMSCHDAEEFSFFISGELHSFCGEREDILTPGTATWIHKGEEHYCENRGVEPAVIACCMLK